MSNRVEIVVLAVLLGLVGIIVVGSILALGLFGTGVRSHSSGGVVTVSSCVAAPSGAQVTSSC